MPLIASSLQSGSFCAMLTASVNDSQPPEWLTLCHVDCFRQCQFVQLGHLGLSSSNESEDDQVASSILLVMCS